MNKQNGKPEDAALLRQKAEEKLKLYRDVACNVSTDSKSEPDLLKLIYELEVHQIELEMQNEELVIAKERAELAEEKYTELYDFAPSGYIALSKKGEILELNFAAANMLGKERTKLINKRFDYFVSVDTQTTFNLFLIDVFTSKVKLSCEVIIATEGNLPIYANIDGIVSQNNELCLLTLNDITERIRAKKELQASEKKFWTLSENSPAVIYRMLLKPSMKFVYVSPVVTEITGYTPEDHYADPDLGFKLVHPDDRMILENSTHKTQGEPIVMRWVKKDGKTIWTEQRNVLVFDDEGDPIAIEGIAIDITLQKEAEIELIKAKEQAEESEKKYRQLYDSNQMPISIFEIDSLKFLSVNNAMIQKYGYTNEEFLTMTILDIRPPSEIEKVKLAARKIDEGLVNAGIYLHKKKNGEIIHVEIIRCEIVYEGKRAKLVFANDVSERIKIGQELIQVNNELQSAIEQTKESEEKYRNIVSILPDGVVIHQDGIVVFENESARRIFKAKDGESLIGKNAIDFVHPKSRQSAIDRINKVLTDHVQANPMEEIFLDFAGNSVDVLVTGIPINYEGKNSKLSVFTDITERKQSELALKRTQSLLKSSIESLQDNVFLAIDKNYCYLNFNKAHWNAMNFAYDADIQIGGNTLDFITNDADRRKAKEGYDSAMSGKALSQIAMFGDVKPAYYESFFNPIYDENNHIIGATCLSNNISARLQSEVEIRASQQLLKKVLSSLLDAVFIIDAATVEIIDCNPAATSIFGYTREEMMGKTTEFMHVDLQALDQFRHLLYSAVEEKGFLFLTDYRMRRKDTSIFPTEHSVIPIYDENGKRTGWVSTVRDITERKQAEEAIKKAGLHYQALIEKAPDGIALISTEGNFKYLSPAAKKMFGYSQTDEVSGNPAEYTHPDDLPMVLTELGKIHADPGYVPTLEYRFKDKIGQWHWVETTFSNLLADPSVESIVLNFHDITERKLMEDTQAFLLQISNPGSDENFFESLAKYLSQSLDMEYVCIDLLEGDRLNAKTLAIYNKGNFDPNVSYALKDTPCGEVIGNHICCYPQEVRSLFPKDSALEDIKAESYIGTTLWSFDGQPIGLIAVIGQKPMQNQESAAAVLKLVSLRAAGKLEATLAEEKVRESEEKFRVLIKSTSVGIYLTDLNGKCTFVNPKWCEMAQLTDNEALSDGWINGIYEEDREKVFENWQKMIASDGNWGFEYRFGTPDKLSWVYGTAKSYKNESGDIVGFIGSNVDITERKQSEAIIRDIIEKNPMSIQILDMEGYPVQVNPAHTKLFGVVPPSNYSIFKDSQLLALGFVEFFERIKKGEVVYFPDSYYNVHDVDPSYPNAPVWVKALGFTLNDMSGNPNKIIIMHENITERKNAEALLNDIIENNPMSIQVVDKEGYMQRGNPAFVELFGAVPPPHFSIFEDLKSKSTELGNLVSLVKDGQIVHLPDIYFNAHDAIAEAPNIPLWIRALIFPLRDTSGKPERFVFMHENITERRIAEQELMKAKELAEESEKKFREMAELLPQIVFETDVQGNLTYVNKYAYKLTGYSEEDSIVGKNTLEFYIPEDRERALQNIKMSFTGGKHLGSNEYTMIRKDGSTFNILVYSNPIFKDAKPVGLRGIIVDISELKQTEQELIKAKDRAEESDRLKSAFLANMSHEIRTPMNGILGFSELLKEPGLTGDQQQGYISIIEKSGLRMLNIINNIIDISKIEAGLVKLYIKESNINEQFEYIYTFFKPEVEAKGMKLSFKNTLASKDAIIRTDTEKLYAILTNLVKNAIKYTNEGSIELGYNIVETLHATSLPATSTHSLQFYVKDTGIGIPKERQSAIFERFIQADVSDKMAYQGAGLGLAISKAYVEMLGGKIWVDSEVGRGSTFYFTLPYHAEPGEKRAVGKVVPLQKERNQVNPVVSGLKIVIAEDDETSEMLIYITLREFGKEIIKVKSGIEAVEICRNRPDLDLILMDIQMPGLNGYEATKQIRQFNKNVVIIAQTAFGMSGDREKAINSGCNDYLSKPIDKNELLALIQMYFGK